MIFIDDSKAGGSRVEIIHPFGRRALTHAIHDIDGTHSLIRDWPPVMSLSMHWAMTCGLGPDYDSPENVSRLIEQVGKKSLPETDGLCRENAGFSAITQLEYGVRRALELGNYPREDVQIADEDKKRNSEIIARLRRAEERYPDIRERAEISRFINTHTPRLFRLYEKILNGACRDRNTADAWKHPARWRVPGSLEFVSYLHALGIVNYFVTGAVVFEEGGMQEEVQALGFEIGPGKMIESLRGSSWNVKMPKNEVIADIIRAENLDAGRVLIIGDGRTEIQAGVAMGAITMSRIPGTDRRMREIHVGLGVHMIVEDYTDPALREMIYRE